MNDGFGKTCLSFLYAVGQASLAAPLMPLAYFFWPHTDLIHHLADMTERQKGVRGGLLFSLHARLEVCALVHGYLNKSKICQGSVTPNKQLAVTSVGLNH